ncbi:heat shock protein [Salpingoeca rosetta]|uniref:Heat shock protein n=1 Tax=Salpingoeca rosetta (strain ATCC 50818 / BSB-021) TaxID=946362 RepID=F2UE88_SALR5|nr:heat shock protein [Salpingoeca rosetta]XP_004992603.1 heat shock protein [Salpingoeca rosetta]EGD74938.1 heat shock protein [Salpingoeca rosetta]EGD74958.1 heat shock protein [Salpingoeca rosetta]|eukprot:XP_004992583.1 heat shock protein [Salpingoeca rosetta]
MSLSLYRDPFFDSWDMFPFRGEEQKRFNMLGSCDIVESKDAHIFTMDTPGMSKDDVKIEVENDVLTVSGERKSKHEEKDDKVHRVERHYGSFKRSFGLPEGVDASKVKAKFDNGQLRIEVPKPPQSAKKAKTQVAISN